MRSFDVYVGEYCRASVMLLDTDFSTSDILVCLFPPGNKYHGELNHILIRNRIYDKEFLLEIYGTNDYRKILIAYGEDYDHKQYTKDGFILRLSKEYPKYFEWLLFHPEIFEGKYHPDGTEIRID